MAASKRQSQSPVSTASDLEGELALIAGSGVAELRALWRASRGSPAPAGLTKDLMARALAFWVQEARLGGVRASTRKSLQELETKRGRTLRWLKPGTVLVREHAGVMHEVVVVPGGYLWGGATWPSLSAIALRITGTSWNGARFFGLLKQPVSNSSGHPS